MARQLFGTDGIRSVAGQYPLEPRTVHCFGAALAEWAAKHSERPEVIIGMDTRESGIWLAEQVAGGLARHGVKARFAGLTTTPGVAYLTKTMDFVAGVMISASHNPYLDNGLKVFAHTGYKLADEDEEALEAGLFRFRESGLEAKPLTLIPDENLDQTYTAHLASTFSGTLLGMKLVVDCANGAATHLAPKLFRNLGAEVIAIGCDPNGRNINLDCGAMHTGKLLKKVLETGAGAGVAFDGDADRAMFVSKAGKIVDGDHVLLLTARAMKAKGHLPGNKVVATVMSNLGLERALESDGIGLVRTPVGDKYVLEEMIRSGAGIGGEQSGHVIFHEHATTGDGMLTAIRVFETVRDSGRDLDELTADFKIYPQTLVNVKFRVKRPLADLHTVNAEIRKVETAFGTAGRVVVRFSGTEPLARVMVEGPELPLVKDAASRIAEAIRLELA